MSTRTTPADDRRAEINQALVDAHAMRSPAELVETVHNIPTELAVAFMTGRPELIGLAAPRVLTEAECAAVYKLVGALIRTNFALQAHANEIGRMADNVLHQVRGGVVMVDTLRAFAAFRHNEPADGEE